LRYGWIGARISQSGLTYQQHQIGANTAGCINTAGNGVVACLVPETQIRTIHPQARSQVDVPDGLWKRCQECQNIVYEKELLDNLSVCPHCNFHHPISARERNPVTFDPESFVEMDADLASVDPLGFPEYAAKLEKSRTATGLNEAVITGLARLEERPVRPR